MKPSILLLPLALALLLPSCREPVETIRGRVTIYPFSLITDMNLPVREGLPVTISRDGKPFTVAHTDTAGYYQFTTSEFQTEELMRYSAYFLKRVPFDPTLVEWMYTTDSTLFRHSYTWQDWDVWEHHTGTGEVTLEEWMARQKPFTHRDKLVYDPNQNTFHVVPAGWVQLQFLNLQESVHVWTGNPEKGEVQWANYPPDLITNRGVHFILTPGELHEFSVTGSDALRTFKFSIHVNNSFDPSSTPGHERLAPDTVRIDMLTQEVEVVRPKF